MIYEIFNTLTLYDFEPKFIDRQIFEIFKWNNYPLLKIREGWELHILVHDKWCDLFILANIFSLLLPSCVNHSHSKGSGVAAVDWGVGGSNVFCNVLIRCNHVIVIVIMWCNAMVSTLQILLWQFCCSRESLFDFNRHFNL